MPIRPHLFPAVLDSLMQERGVKQVGLAALTGIAVSRVNNYLKGNYRNIKPAHLAVIAEALGGKPADTAALVQGYLFDLLPEGCRGLVEIRVAGAKETGKWEVPSKGLPKAFAADFRELYRLCVADPRVLQRTAEWIAIMQETRR